MVTRPQAAAPAPAGSRVTIRLFARLGELTGARVVALDCDNALTAREAYLRLCQRFPNLITYDGKLLFAVNAEYASPDSLLQDGDELTLITPVSGG